MRSDSDLILGCGDIIQSSISFIREIRNKHNIPKDKLVLYIDMLSKDVDNIDVLIIKSEGILLKQNTSNLAKVEYSLYELFESGVYFESTYINGYNIYLTLPMIQKESQINDFNNEVNRLEIQKIKYQNKLSDTKFISKAPKDIVESERKKLNDSEIRIQKLKANMLMLTCGKEYYDLLLKFGGDEKINWYIQYERELQTINEPYTPNWFSEIYNPQITDTEIKMLHTKIK